MFYIITALILLFFFLVYVGYITYRDKIFVCEIFLYCVGAFLLAALWPLGIPVLIGFAIAKYGRDLARHAKIL
jgi:hypothetical protein